MHGALVPGQRASVPLDSDNPGGGIPFSGDEASHKMDAEPKSRKVDKKGLKEKLDRGYI